MDLMKLYAPFPPERISWRIGSTNGEKTKGMALAYIDSRDVQDRLDQACGPENWQCRYPHAGQKTVCEIGLKIDGEWIWKADGAGDSDVEAEKGALSDAFKRAAVKWGVGRYLYDLDSPWVAITQKGRSYVIADGEYKKLEALLKRQDNTKPEPEKKSAPGVSKAKKWMNDITADMQECDSADGFMNLLEGARTPFVRLCAVFPDLWAGPNGWGLKEETRRIAGIVGADCNAFIADVEMSALEVTQTQAAQ